MCGPDLCGKLFPFMKLRKAYDQLLTRKVFGMSWGYMVLEGIYLKGACRSFYNVCATLYMNGKLSESFGAGVGMRLVCDDIMTVHCLHG